MRRRIGKTVEGDTERRERTVGGTRQVERRTEQSGEHVECTEPVVGQPVERIRPVEEWRPVERTRQIERAVGRTERIEVELELKK